jgi:hypothetical protein
VFAPTIAKVAPAEVAPALTPSSSVVFEPDVAPLVGPPDLVESTSQVFGPTLTKAPQKVVSPALVVNTSVIPMPLVVKPSSRHGDRGVKFSVNG